MDKRDRECLNTLPGIYWFWQINIMKRVTLLRLNTLPGIYWFWPIYAVFTAAASSVLIPFRVFIDSDDYEALNKAARRFGLNTLPGIYWFWPWPAFMSFRGASGLNTLPGIYWFWHWRPWKRRLTWIVLIPFRVFIDSDDIEAIKKYPHNDNVLIPFRVFIDSDFPGCSRGKSRRFCLNTLPGIYWFWLIAPFVTTFGDTVLIPFRVFIDSDVSCLRPIPSRPVRLNTLPGIYWFWLGFNEMEFEFIFGLNTLPGIYWFWRTIAGVTGAATIMGS